MSRPPASLAAPAVCVRVPAKVNLALTSGPRHADGYHELETIFQAVSLYDQVTVTARADAELALTMSGRDVAAIGTGEDNLAYRAAALLRQSHGHPGLGAAITITKAIPVAGGMAGGSADAAATLLACNQIWQLGLPLAELLELAAGLGADVPFPLLGGCALGTGRGDRLTPVLSRGTYHWVLAFAHTGLSTAAVFRRFDERADGAVSVAADAPGAVMRALTTADPRALAASLGNDLERAALALRPDLGRTMAAGLEAGALAALLSGSGPTVAFLVANEADAVDLIVRLSSCGVARQLLKVTGPVAGARVVA